MIKNMKIGFKIEDIVKEVPESFKIYFEHVFSLEFTQKPNYDMLKQTFLKDLFLNED